MALPLALPEVHMFVADVFAETAEELWRIEKDCGIVESARIKKVFAAAEEKLPDCHRQWQDRRSTS